MSRSALTGTFYRARLPMAVLASQVPTPVMTPNPAADKPPAPPERPGRDLRVTGLIGAGHFLSHFYILALPPLFPLLRVELEVGYTALGFALGVLNAVTAITQAPVGFLVDRFGARWILIGGLALFASSTALVGVFPSYPALLVLMALAGLGNAVFHPADYAILSASVGDRRMGRAFSIHTSSGYFGFAAAPVVIVFLTELFGWQAALLVAGGFGLLVAGAMIVLRESLEDDAGHHPRAGSRADLRLLMSRPVLLALLFFVLIALAHGGVSNYGVAAIEELFRVSLIEANVPLTAYLFMSAIGVLAGGVVADRIRHHERVVAICFVLVALAVIPIGAFRLPMIAVTLAFALAGFFSGVVAPSRDLMVRAITPPGQSGKVFGFVMTGFNIGGILMPLVFGIALDLGHPALVFWLIALVSLSTLPLLLGGGRREAASERRL